MSAGGPPAGRKAAAQRARLPLLARLCDAGQGSADQPVTSSTEALDILRQAVRRDVEALLNARRRRRPLLGHLRELSTSLLQYGIPDPISGTYAIPELRDELVRDIEATIRRFEPRLQEVTVTVTEDREALGGTLRMRVNAVLRADPIPEAVTFETRLETVSRDITVREA